MRLLKNYKNLKCNFGNFMLTFMEAYRNIMSFISDEKSMQWELLVKDDIEDIENNTSTFINKKEYLKIEFLKVMSHKKISAQKLKLNQ